MKRCYIIVGVVFSYFRAIVAVVDVWFMKCNLWCVVGVFYGKAGLT